MKNEKIFKIREIELWAFIGFIQGLMERDYLDMEIDELIEMNEIEILGKKICQITGKKVEALGVTKR